MLLLPEKAWFSFFMSVSSVCRVAGLSKAGRVSPWVRRLTNSSCGFRFVCIISGVGWKQAFKNQTGIGLALNCYMYTFTILSYP